MRFRDKRQDKGPDKAREPEEPLEVPPSAVEVEPVQEETLSSGPPPRAAQEWEREASASGPQPRAAPVLLDASARWHATRDLALQGLCSVSANAFTLLDPIEAGRRMRILEDLAGGSADRIHGPCPHEDGAQPERWLATYSHVLGGLCAVSSSAWAALAWEECNMRMRILEDLARESADAVHGACGP